MKTNILSSQIKWWTTKSSNETKGGSFNYDHLIRVLKAKLNRSEKEYM